MVQQIVEVVCYLLLLLFVAAVAKWRYALRVLRGTVIEVQDPGWLIDHTF